MTTPIPTRQFRLARHKLLCWYFKTCTDEQAEQFADRFLGLIVQSATVRYPNLNRMQMAAQVSRLVDRFIRGDTTVTGDV